METRRVNIGALEMNIGQIPGVPSNPRDLSKDDIARMAKSLVETPELFEMRPCIVKQTGGTYVILGGNLRYQGSIKAKLKDVPCLVVPDEWDADKLKEIVIKDNGSFGSWDFDALANEWDDLPLTDWGVPAWNTEPEEEDKPKEEKKSEYKATLTFPDEESLNQFRALYADDIVAQLHCVIV